MNRYDEYVVPDWLDRLAYGRDISDLYGMAKREMEDKLIEGKITTETLIDYIDNNGKLLEFTKWCIGDDGIDEVDNDVIIDFLIDHEELIEGTFSYEYDNDYGVYIYNWLLI